MCLTITYFENISWVPQLYLIKRRYTPIISAYTILPFITEILSSVFETLTNASDREKRDAIWLVTQHLRIAKAPTVWDTWLAYNSCTRSGTKLPSPSDSWSATTSMMLKAEYSWMTIQILWLLMPWHPQVIRTHGTDSIRQICCQ